MLSCRMKTRTRSQDENRDLTIYFINRQFSVSTSSHRSPSPPHGPDRRVRNINSNWQYSSDQGQCWPGRRLVQQASLDASGSTRQHCDTDEPDSRLLEQGTGCESIQTGLAVKKKKKKNRHWITSLPFNKPLSLRTVTDNALKSSLQKYGAS